MISSVKEKRLARRTLPDVRAQFARMVDAGVSADAIKAALSLKKATYYKWRALYRSGGLAALEVRAAPGGPTKLTDRQMGKLRGWIIGRDPSQFQFEFQLWTRKIVRDFIRERFDVEFTIQGVGVLLRRMNMSPQRPAVPGVPAGPRSCRALEEEEYPKIRAEAAQVGARIFFEDEASPRSDHHSGTTWAPRVQTPVVTKTGARFTVNMELVKLSV